MSAVAVATAFGGPEVLSVIDEPTPEPGPGEVRIEVRASGVNPIDYKLYGGTFGADPSSLPKRVGLEAAGVVTAVGTDATGPAGPVTAGDEVIAFGPEGAACAEYVVPATAVVPKPATMSWEAASGLLLTGGTAVHCLEAVSLEPGQTVLVHGASGGVGLLLVQLAVARGATVIATASKARHDQLREFGAVPVAYGAGLADRVREAAPSGIDAAIDLVGTDEAVDVSLELVDDHARIASIAAFGRADTGIQLLGNGPGGDPGTDIRDASRLRLTKAVENGTLRVLVAKTYPLSDIAAAHREIMSGHTNGKIALLP